MKRARDARRFAVFPSGQYGRHERFVPAILSFSLRMLREARGECVDLGVCEYLDAMLAQQRRRHARAGLPTARKTSVVEFRRVQRPPGLARRLA